MTDPLYETEGRVLLIRELEGPEDQARLREGFQQVFNSQISPEFLHWKYGEGRGHSWGAFADDGTLLAHCGVVYRDVLAEGVPRRIGQLCDLLATPARSDGLSRKHSAFFLLLEAVLASAPDVRDNPDGLCFGFPSERAMRLSERLGLCVYIDQVYEFRLPAVSAPRGSWWTVRQAQANSRGFATGVNRLWRVMAEELSAGLVGVRDAAYLHHRYVSHPEHGYELHWVGPCWGRSVACAVLRRQDVSVELMDLVGRVEDMPRVVEALQRHLPRLGGNALTMWVTKGQLHRFPQALADQAVALQFRVMANPHSPGHGLYFADRWWLTSGDTDYR